MKFKRFNTETEIHFSQLPLMKPTGNKTPGGHSIWVFAESMTIWWHCQTTKKKYTLRIPTNFHTDFSSTPSWIWWWLPPFDPKYTPGCLPHDLGYEKCGELVLWVEDLRTGLRTPLETQWTRHAVDDLMLAGMRSNGTSEFKCQAIYRAVRLGGWGAWDRAKQARTAGQHKRRIDLGYTHGVRD